LGSSSRGLCNSAVCSESFPDGLATVASPHITISAQRCVRCHSSYEMRGLFSITERCLLQSSWSSYRRLTDCADSDASALARGTHKSYMTGIGLPMTGNALFSSPYMQVASRSNFEFKNSAGSQVRESAGDARFVSTGRYRGFESLRRLEAVLLTADSCEESSVIGVCSEDNDPDTPSHSSIGTGSPRLTRLNMYFQESRLLVLMRLVL
jgi:hypothetical protein